ncbi:MAG TPA: hypothetical protein DCO72_06830 [Ruminococcus sp.]|nr:hypothetical protein [Ruminococcus sp.]
MLARILIGIGFVLLGGLSLGYCWLTKKNRSRNWVGFLLSGAGLVLGGIWYLLKILEYIIFK